MMALFFDIQCLKILFFFSAQVNAYIHTKLTFKPNGGSASNQNYSFQMKNYMNYIHLGLK